MDHLRKIAQANKKGNPFSAKIVEKSTGRSVIAVNQVIAKKDPTAHDEMEAIREAGEKRFNFEDCTITSSGEPCPMCATAIAWCGIKKIYYLDSHVVAYEKGFNFDQDVHRVNELLNLGLQITRISYDIMVL